MKALIGLLTVGLSQGCYSDCDLTFQSYRFVEFTVDGEPVESSGESDSGIPWASEDAEAWIDDLAEAQIGSADIQVSAGEFLVIGELIDVDVSP